jgi:hypothetical protein
VTAPEPVVLAVMEAYGCGANSNGFCNRHHSVWTGRGCRDAVEATDAAFAASLEWAAERVEGPSEIPLHASTCVYLASELRRWARGAS